MVPHVRSTGNLSSSCINDNAHVKCLLNDRIRKEDIILMAMLTEKR